MTTKRKPAKSKLKELRVSLADLKYLRSWVFDQCDETGNQNKRACQALDRLIYATAILAAEIDFQAGGGGDCSEDAKDAADRKTLAAAMDIGRLAAEVPGDY